MIAHLLSLTPFKRIVKDYFMICDSYYAAIRTATPDQIEAIDMGRRGLHDEGSRILQDAPQAQGQGRFRHRAPPVHADLRAALEGLSCPMDRRMRRAAREPHAVLFACGLNSVRSPMAAGLFKQIIGRAIYVASAGVRKGELDPFAVAALEEIGLDISRHRPMTFEELEDWEGLNFDLIVTLSPEAHHKALELTRTIAADVEYWPTPDPTATEGTREQRLDAYREVRDQLTERIKERFGWQPGGNE